MLYLSKNVKINKIEHRLVQIFFSFKMNYKIKEL